MHNKVILIILLILFMAMVSLNLAIKPKPDEKEIRDISSMIRQSYMWRDKYAPDFELVLLDGQKFILSEHVGKKVIILNFFATWCRPCKEEIPEFVSYYQKRQGEEFIIVGIDAKEKRDLVEQFIVENKIKFPIGIDVEGDIQKKYGIESYPTTIFIGTDGKIAFYEVGAISNTDVTFENLYKENIRIIRAKGGIDKQTYLEKQKNQKLPINNKVTGDEDEDAGDVKLDGRAKEIAEKIKVPWCERGNTMDKCTSEASISIRKKLSQMNLDNKTDEEILKELFLESDIKDANSK